MSEELKNKFLAGASGEGGGGSGTFIPLSLPNCEVDDSPLQGNALNKNKESLKVKLMLRRPREDLVNRGVIPPMNTPTAFYEQRQRLEMAKRHDILKHKMQRRPLREELVRQHILEDSPGNMDPSLVEKQKQLKRARIADTLSDHLSLRPGPLELVRANILHTTEDLEKAVKEGQLMFKSTCEGEPRKHPSLYVSFDDESSSEGGTSPELLAEGVTLAQTTTTDTTTDLSGVQTYSQSRLSTVSSSSSSSSSIVSANTAVIHAVPATFVTTTFAPTTIISSCAAAAVAAAANVEVPPSPSFASNTSSLSPLSSLASPPPQQQHTFLHSPQTPLAQTLLVAQTPLPHALTTPPQQCSAPGKDPIKSRKKMKGKTPAKTRTIKFHEYKGPPSAVRRDHSKLSETSYDILLQQQQLFLQCQLELKQKFTQIILPAPMKTSNVDGGSSVTLPSVLALASTPPLTSSSCSGSSTPVVIAAPGNPPIAPAPPSTNAAPPPPALSPEFALKLPAKIEDLKVTDLKLELKRRNLPVSGSKPQLIERLKFYGNTPFCLINKNTTNATVNGAGGSCSSDKVVVVVGKNKEANATERRQKAEEERTEGAVFLPRVVANCGGGSSTSRSSSKTDPTTTKSSSELTNGSCTPVQASCRVGSSDVISSAYQHLSSRPSSNAPMDVDFEASLDIPDLRRLPSYIPQSVSDYSDQREGGSINTPPPNDVLLSSTASQFERETTSNGRGWSSYHDSRFSSHERKPETPSNTRVEATFLSSSEHQEGIDHLKRKIEDLQRELLSTQQRLEDQQKRGSVCKSKDSTKTASGFIVGHNVPHASQVSQEQRERSLHSHLRQLKVHLQNEQIHQLEKSADSNAEISLPSRNPVPRMENNATRFPRMLISQKKSRCANPAEAAAVFQQPTTTGQAKPAFNYRKPELTSPGNSSRDGSFHVSNQFRPTSFFIPSGVIVSTHHHRTASLPSFSGSGVQSRRASEVAQHSPLSYLTEAPLHARASLSPSSGNSQQQQQQQHPHFKPPPNYNEAVKQFRGGVEHREMKCALQPPQKTIYKSHQVDDVLEILIKNGELPPSAAHEEPVDQMMSQHEEAAMLYSSSLDEPPNAASRIPPPPPPPPSHPTNQRLNGVCTSSGLSGSPSSIAFSSPSLFADLVMMDGGNTSTGFDLRLDLDLPMFEGVEELGAMGCGEECSPPLPPHACKGDFSSKKNNNNKVPTDVVKMEISEDVDVASWLDSINPLPPLPPPPPPPLPTSNASLLDARLSWGGGDPLAVIVANAASTFEHKTTPDSRTSSGVSSMRSSLSNASSASSSTCALNYNQCDPLLGSHPDHMDIFSVDDLDLRPTSSSSELSWDRIDFPA